MNKTLLTGRLTRDPELRRTQGGTPVCRFNLAVSRPSTEGDADFIPCIAWGKTAENLVQYMRQGGLLAIEGRIQVSTYEKDGQKKWDIHVVAGRIEFMGNKQQEPLRDLVDESQRVSEFGTEVTFSDDDLPF